MINLAAKLKRNHNPRRLHKPRKRCGSVRVPASYKRPGKDLRAGKCSIGFPRGIRSSTSAAPSRPVRAPRISARLRAYRTPSPSSADARCLPTSAASVPNKCNVRTKKVAVWWHVAILRDARGCVNLREPSRLNSIKRRDSHGLPSGQPERKTGFAA